MLFQAMVSKAANKNSVDYPSPRDAHYQQLMDNFETVVFDKQSQQDVEDFFGKFLELYYCYNAILC